MNESYDGPGAPLRAPDAGTLVRGVIRDVAAHGSLRRSDNDLEVRELLSVNTVLIDPRARLMRSRSHPQIYNPGLAVARFFYLLSGSHDLDSIVFYSPSAARFTDDGLTMPGGAHGFRLFHPVSSVDQFEGVVSALRAHPERNRAVVSLYHPQDCGSLTADLTCVMGAMFSCKEDRLETLVNMRANDALRLLWHDMFEFSMLGEYIARFSGFRLGAYYHSSFVMMLIGRQAYDSAAKVIAEDDPAPIMAAMPAVDGSTRLRLVRAERRIRAVVAGQSSDDHQRLLTKLAEQEEPYWADLLTALAIQGRMVHQEPRQALRELETLTLHDDFVVARETAMTSLLIARHRADEPVSA